MLKIILSLMFFIIMIIIQYITIEVMVTKVSDSTDRVEKIIFLFASETIVLICGVFLGLINC